MKCFEKRTIFNFWEYLSCDKCKYKLDDEEIIIGNNKIYIYNIKICCKESIDNDNLFLKNKKVKIFLKDCVINQNKIIFLILEDFSLEKNIKWIEGFLEENIDIHILNI